MYKRIIFLVGVISCIVFYILFNCSDPPPIKVGILYSFTGNLAISESHLADATLLAIKEINEKGGLLGRKIEPIIADAASDLETFATKAESVITKENVCAIFGCYTSASRKQVKPIVERYNSLLFYPVPYEGVETSYNIVYNGAAPNQLYIPAVKWCFDNIGERFFLVGSDYIWPRTVHALMKDLIIALKGKILGEEFLLLGSDKVQDVVGKIDKTKPDIILSTIVGTTNIAFYNELLNAGITPDKIPAMAFAISEVELSQMDATKMAGNYSCWSYFQSVNTQANHNFVTRFKNEYGKNRVTNDSIESGYFGVYIWAQAVRDALSTETNPVRKALRDQSFEAPGGVVYIDGDNLHTWKMARIGKVQSNGQFKIVWSSQKPVRPVPFPIYRPKSDWISYINSFYTKWGQRWSNPGSTE
jgi:urea transport system substrate-binding protein